jgi:hypothetical protein
LIDWECLKRLRANFLSEEPGTTGDYWKSEHELEQYDETFAQRIGWKWDAVCTEAAARGWRPPVGARLLDWGCGTGVATRKFLECFSSDGFTEILLSDRSAKARAYARKQVPGARDWDGEMPPGNLVLLLSHVLNELEAPDRAGLMRLARKAHSVFWVEPGAPRLSRELVAIREELREELFPLAPCPHTERCGLLVPENDRHWCHHFAPAPREVFTEAKWAHFSRELGIDLRSLPVSFLVLSREKSTDQGPHLNRVIGRPRIYKGYAKVLLCRREGVFDEKMLMRAEPELVKQLEAANFTCLLERHEETC